MKTKVPIHVPIRKDSLWLTHFRKLCFVTVVLTAARFGSVVCPTVLGSVPVCLSTHLLHRAAGRAANPALVGESSSRAFGSLPWIGNDSVRVPLTTTPTWLVLQSSLDTCTWMPAGIYIYQFIHSSMELRGLEASQTLMSEAMHKKRVSFGACITSRNFVSNQSRFR